MKLGILLDHLGAEPGGAEAHTLALMQRAVGVGDEVVLATLDGIAPEGVERIGIAAPRGRPARDATFAQVGARRLREVGCDVVFAIRHAPSCDVYLPHGGLTEDARAGKDRAAGAAGPLARLARRLSGKHAFFRRAERQLLDRDAGPTVIAVSDDLALRIQRRYPASADRVVTVRNGVDAAHFARPPFLEAGRALRAELDLEDALVGLLLARHPTLKGVETAIRALDERAVRTVEPSFVLLVAGGDLPASMVRLARRLGVSERVRTLPAVADPRPLYAAADLLVHPTWYDPCSLVCLEALAMELPVITTVCNGVHEIMGKRGGVVVQPGDVYQLTKAIRTLSDREVRTERAAEARTVALENPMRDRLDEVLALCRRVAGGA